MRPRWPLWLGTRRKRAKWVRRAHAVFTAGWVVMLPVALATGWVYSLVFISGCSIYANAAAHLAGLQGAEARKAADGD